MGGLRLRAGVHMQEGYSGVVLKSRVSLPSGVGSYPPSLPITNDFTLRSGLIPP